MNNSPILATELREKNPKDLPSRAKDFSSYSFWQYTRLVTADLIISSNTFRIGNLEGMNDLDEAELHASEKRKLFALCFCNSDTEKIPMWYLYSGIDGKGAAIGYTPAKMLNWLKGIRTVYGVQNGQKKEDGDKLAVGTDVEFQWGWVFYQKAHEPQNIMYRNKWFKVDDVDEFEKANYFIKSYPWEYEKEFRIVFRNLTKTNYDALFVEIQPALKVKLAPEISAAQFKKIRGLKSIGKELTPLYSELAIRMNLFNRNKTSLIEYISEEVAKSKPGIDVKDICGAVQSAGQCKGTP